MKNGPFQSRVHEVRDKMSAPVYSTQYIQSKSRFVSLSGYSDMVSYIYMRATSVDGARIMGSFKIVVLSIFSNLALHLVDFFLNQNLCSSIKSFSILIRLFSFCKQFRARFISAVDSLATVGMKNCER